MLTPNIFRQFHLHFFDIGCLHLLYDNYAPIDDILPPESFTYGFHLHQSNTRKFNFHGPIQVLSLSTPETSQIDSNQTATDFLSRAAAGRPPDWSS